MTLQRCVDGADAERFGIKSTSSGQHVFVLLVLRVRKGFEIFGITEGTAAVFLKPISRASDAFSQNVLAIGRVSVAPATAACPAVTMRG